MERSHVSLLTALLVLLAGSPALARDWSVELIVHESAGVDRADEPVSGGVPLPMGLVKQPADVHLTDANGKEVPAQFSAINRWGHDGSVCWLLVQSRATVPAKGATTFFLKPGAAKRGRSGLVVKDANDAVTVNTGTVRFVVSKKGYLLQDARFDANADGKYGDDEQVLLRGWNGSWFTLAANGEIYGSNAAPPEQVVVEEAGPERATILIRGRHKTFLGEKGTLPYLYGYVARIRAYAGRSSLRISYAVTNDALPPIGAPNCKAASIGLALMRPFAEQKGGEGWVSAATNKLGVVMAVRYLKENAPAKLKVVPGATHNMPGGPLPPSLGLLLWGDQPDYLDVCSHKTYELELVLGGKNLSATGDALARQFNSPLRLWCRPEWVAKAKAWGDFGGLAVPDDNMKTWIARRFRPFRSTGWRHHGSTPSMESGSSRAPSGGYEPIITDGHFYLGYMLTGDRRYFDQLERTSWHWRDRHFIHLQKDISNVKWPGRGGVYYKYMADGGKAFPKVQLPDYRRRFHGRWNYGGRWGPMDTQHFSVDEVVNYYYLTGDRSCLAAINKYGEEAASFVNAFVKAKGAKVSRQHGWCTRALMGVYEATNEKRWLDLARQAVYAIIAAQDKRVGTIYDVKQQQVPFMAAAVGMALGRYYKHHPEEEVRDAILGLADWLCYDVAARDGGFSYRWDWDKKGGRSASGNRCMSTMGWAYLATGQKRYMDAADAHAGFKARGERALAPWYLSGFGQEYVSLKKTKRPDSVLPGAVKDLAAKALGGGKVRLTWTAPGDDANQGTAAEYQVKHAVKEIKERSDWRTKPDTEISFWAATNCKGEPKPAKAGAKQTFVVEGLKPGVHWFALKTYDEQPNQSDLSNVVKVEVK